MSLKFLRLPVAISTTIVLSLSFFTTAGIAQDYPVCFMVNSLGQIVNLNNLCQRQTQSQVLQKSKACQGPFDSDGFPIALSSEWERLKTVATKAKNGNDYSSYFIEFQSAMISLLEQVPFSEHSQKLLQEQRNLLNQLQAKLTPEEGVALQEKLTINNDELSKQLNQSPCYERIMQSLDNKLG